MNLLIFWRNLSYTFTLNINNNPKILLLLLLEMKNRYKLPEEDRQIGILIQIGIIS